MVTGERREQVRARLFERAREDDRIVGVAITGSAAGDAQDRWSDIDLFFGVAGTTPPQDAVEDWTVFLSREFGVLHHFDLRSGPALYRAFLLPGPLEVDLGFTPAAEFGPVGDGGFRVVFGEAAPRRAVVTDPDHLIGLAWHHVLHARSSVERGAWWRAEYWISALRDHTLTLACLRLGLPDAHAKGADLLPLDVTGPLQDALVRGLDPAELNRALRVATSAFLRELRTTAPALAATLGGTLLELAAPGARGVTPGQGGSPSADGGSRAG